jgi:cephalosporin hydroxylase
VIDRIYAQIHWPGDNKTNPYRLKYLCRDRFPRLHGALKCWILYQQTRREILGFLSQLVPEVDFAPLWEAFFQEHDTFLAQTTALGPFSYYDFTFRGVMSFNPMFYALVLALRPKLIVETGVAAGFGSLGWLQGLQAVGAGALISFDRPPPIESEDFLQCRQWSWQYRPTGSTSGWAVADSLRKRWTLYEGDSVETMRMKSEELQSIDIFYHDSQHTYEHMGKEFEIIRSRVRQGGLILADDATGNSAFRELASFLGTSFFSLHNDLMALRVP